MKTLNQIVEEYHHTDSAMEPTNFEPRKDSQKAEQNKAHDLHDKLKKHYSFGDEAHKAIQTYTGRSNSINGQLWNQSQVKTDYPLSQSKGHERTIENLDKVLNTHKTPHELTVWSKSAHDPRKLADSSGSLHHPAFMSTSIQRSVAKNLAWNHTTDGEGISHHHIYKITVPEGSHGAYVDHHSAMSSQKEFILPRGSNFQYHKTEEQPFGKDRYHYHHVSLIK